MLTYLKNKLCIFNIKQRTYQIINSFGKDKLNIQFDGKSELFITWINFKENELKTLLIDHLDVNPMLFYECTLLSPIDKMFEFGDEAIFHNLILNNSNFDRNPQIMRIIRKGCFSVLILNQSKEDSFQIIDSIVNKFKFSLEGNKYQKSNMSNQVFYQKILTSLPSK